MRKINLDKQFLGAEYKDLKNILVAQKVPLKELNGKEAMAVWDMNEETKASAVFMLRVRIDGEWKELYFYKSHFTNFLRAV